MVIIHAQTILLERGVWGSSPRKKLLELVQNSAFLDNSGGYNSLLLCHNKSRLPILKQIDTLKHIIYINTCRYSSERKDMITIILELYMSKRNWKNI